MANWLNTFLSFFCKPLYDIRCSNKKWFSNTFIGPIDKILIILPLQIRVDLGVMAMKEYSKLLWAPGLEAQHQVQFNVIPRTPPFVGGILLFSRVYNWHILSLTNRTELIFYSFKMKMIFTHKNILMKDLYRVILEKLCPTMLFKWPTKFHKENGFYLNFVSLVSFSLFTSFIELKKPIFLLISTFFILYLYINNTF